MRRSAQLMLPVGLLAMATLVGLLGQDATGQQEKKKKGQGERVRRAVAVLLPTEGNRIAGTVYFTQQRGGEVEITGRIAGLEPGKHGFHVHQYGDLTNLDTGDSAGGHYNPTDMPHGRPEAEERHVGDLGNIEANQSGVAEINMRDDVIRLNGPHSIVGRALVVHAKADEFTQPSGDAGDRVALGVIGIAQPQQGRQQGSR